MQKVFVSKKVGSNLVPSHVVYVPEAGRAYREGAYAAPNLTKSDVPPRRGKKKAGVPNDEVLTSHRQSGPRMGSGGNKYRSMASFKGQSVLIH